MKKVALVTGASSGIGKEIAIQLLKKQYALILSGVDDSKFDYVNSSDEVDIIGGDLTKPEIRNKIIEVVNNKYKHLDLLINNAGISFVQPVEDNTEDQLDSIININLKVPILLTEALYPMFKSQQSGTIVFMNSAAGKQGYENHTMYSASKFGLNGFTQSLRLEAKKHKIRVVSIHPGGVKTNLYNNVKLKPDTNLYMDPAKLAELVVSLSESEGFCPDEISVSRMNK